jgi:hypothetical protein
LNTTDYTGAGPNNQVVRYVTNHDIYGSDGSPYNLFDGRNGTLAALVITAYMKSVPFIYNGVEVGNTVSMPFPFTSTVINWTKDKTVTPEIKKILSLRNYSDAIRRGALTSYDNADVCAFIKVSGTDTVFVVSNLRNADKTFTLPDALVGVSWFDAYTNMPVSLSTTISLTAYQYKVFANKVSSLSIKETPFNPWHISIYPNPVFNGQLTINLNTNEKDLTLKLFDSKGRKVFESRLQTSLNTFNLSSLKKGIYVLTVSNPSGNYSQKISIQ